MCKEKRDKQAQTDLKSSLIQHSRDIPLRAIPHRLGDAGGQTALDPGTFQTHTSAISRPEKN